jgi:glucosamine--fructose-6-phosphate aminotransferase (isomerizing)
LHVVRTPGKIANLEAVLELTPHESTVAIAHTRWATHGRPCEANAHPHTDCSGKLAVVHNGIIENYAELREQLIAQGHHFHSETDTETLAHLFEQALIERGNDPARAAEAIRAALHEVRGAYAVAVLLQDAPDTVFVARKDSPLVIGIGEGENFLASDVTAVMRYTRNVILLEDGDFAAITPTSITVTDLEGAPVNREPLLVTWDDAAAEKGGYSHFMLKEIHDGPRTLRDTLRGRIAEDGTASLPDIALTPENWAKFKRIVIVGCGTAYHAGMVGKRMFEELLRRPVEAWVASEFRYSDPIVDEETLVVLISQSGETADTLAAMREARKKGATTLAVVNVIGSTLAREADVALLTQAGPEIGVASTKAYLAQLAALGVLALYLSGIDTRDGIEAKREELARELARVPELVAECLKSEPEIKALAKQLANYSTFFYLGRGYDFAASLEAALKLKEISYLHAEAYPAGEMKHGPLALVDPGVCVIGFCTQASTREKMISNLQEVKARQGYVVAVIRDDEEAPALADAVIRVPATLDSLMPLVAMAPMQLLAYYIAVERGCEIDQPRNLAKSVTVE